MDKILLLEEETFLLREKFFLLKEAQTNFQYIMEKIGKKYCENVGNYTEDFRFFIPCLKK